MTVTITTALPSTGLQMPTDAQFKKLRAIVEATHPGLAGPHDDREFANAFWAAGMAFRTDGPVTDRYFVGFVDEANAMLQRYGSGNVSATAFLSACLAHADICWRKGDRALGQLLEIGLNAHAGRKCANKWRGLLDGSANLVAPIPPPAHLRESVVPSPVRYFQQDRAGRMQPVAVGNLDMWKR